MLSREVADPRLHSVLVSDVEVSKDLSHARIFVVAPADRDSSETMAGLQAAGGFLRRQLSQRIRLRVVPKLNFVFDDTMDKGARIDALLAAAPKPNDDPESPGDESIDTGESNE